MRDVYSDKADLWWDVDGPFKMLHRMHPHRLRCMQEIIPNLAQCHVLDFACGGGLLSESLSRIGASVVGVDRVLRLFNQHNSMRMSRALRSLMCTGQLIRSMMLILPIIVSMWFVRWSAWSMLCPQDV